MLSISRQLLIVFIFLSFSAKAQLFFENVAPNQNIDYAYKDNNVMGAGVSFCDFDGDGWDDITFATASGDSIMFYKNDNGSFYRVILNVEDTSNIKQVNWVDIDNDGDKDLFLSSYNSSSKLYENLGDMNMLDITLESNIDTSATYNFAASWGDFDNDSYLDVYISNRVYWNSVSNILYKNNGDNTFTDVTENAGLRDTASFSFCSAWFDYNNDGWLDIYCTEDKYNFPNILYKNNGDGTFTDVSVESNAYIFIEAMCATVEDYNYDGWLDVYMTNTQLGNAFLMNNGDDTFSEIADSIGIQYNAIGWGSAFLDGENDGDLDLYVSGMGTGDGLASSAFYENDGSGMFSLPDGIGFIGDSAVSFGNAIGDLNNDGYYDIVVSNIDSSAHLWQNAGGSNNYIKILLEGSESNRDGIGSWIRVYTNASTQIRYTLNGESFCSQFSFTEIIGVGQSSTIDSIEINWLSGITDKFYSIPVNQRLHILEGSSQLAPLQIGYEGSSSTICLGDSISLFVNDEYDHYLWSTGDTTSTITTSETGIISCEAWNDYTLAQVSQIEILQSIPQVNLGPDTLLCENESLLLDIGDGWNSIAWSDGSNEQSLLIDAPGGYSVIVSDSVGCQATDSIMVNMEICLGIEEADLSNKLLLYPNPANSFVLVDCGSDDPIRRIALYDSNGQCVLRMDGNGSDQLKIPLENLSNASYLLFIYTEKKQVSKSLMIQH